jgi:hypothetical protein
MAFPVAIQRLIIDTAIASRAQQARPQDAGTDDWFVIAKPLRTSHASGPTNISDPADFALIEFRRCTEGHPIRRQINRIWHHGREATCAVRLEVGYPGYSVFKLPPLPPIQSPLQ